MLWTVVYKDAHGQQGRLEMVAENRAIVIGNMREQGLQVVNIMDGGLKENSGPRKNRAARLEASARGGGALKWVLVAVLLAVGVGAAAWYACGRPDLLESLREQMNPTPKPKHSGKAVIRMAD